MLLFPRYIETSFYDRQDKIVYFSACKERTRTHESMQVDGKKNDFL